jgi:hypothetical protein
MQEKVVNSATGMLNVSGLHKVLACRRDCKN